MRQDVIRQLRNPANVHQARQQIWALLARRLPGRRCLVREHLLRAQDLAEAIFRRHQVGVGRWRCSHLRQHLESMARHGSLEEQAAMWRTIRLVLWRIERTDDWESHLQGPWARAAAANPIQGDRPSDPYVRVFERP